jgi:cobalamin biosynthesis protein CobT
MAPKAASGSLTEREMEHLRNYLRCLKTKPEVRDMIRHTYAHRSITNASLQVDIDKFTALSGSTTASARTIINRLLNKVAAEETPDTPSNKDNDGEDAAPETPATGKKKGAGRKRKGGEFSSSS